MHHNPASHTWMISVEMHLLLWSNLDELKQSLRPPDGTVVNNDKAA
jgi:hypothetical protein